MSGRVPAGTTVILDGTTGEVVVGADGLELDAAQRRAERPRRRSSLASTDRRPLLTADGVPVRLDANIELVEDLPFLHESGAEGIGLYRSEFLLSGRTIDEATEALQYAAYRSVLEQVAPRRVTIRTFDLDERDLPGKGGRPRARAGLRGLRLGLAHPDLLCLCPLPLHSFAEQCP